MDLNFSYLKDELALAEIRRHKWLESEKSGEEIGFASAALDWIHKYGDEWKRYRLKKANNDTWFSEKRSHRRFVYHMPLKIRIEDQQYITKTEDLNLIGMSCVIPRPPSKDMEAEILLTFPGQPHENRLTQFRFRSRIQNITRSPDETPSSYHRIFVPFEEHVRNFLRTQGERLLTQHSEN